jgi:hypothetical protein
LKIAIDTLLPLDPRRIEVCDAAMAAVLAQKSPLEKLRIGAALWRTARALIRAQVVRAHQDWKEEAVAVEVALRMSRGTA